MPGQGGVPLPTWLRRWAAAVLEFIEAEAAALPSLLRGKRGRRRGRRPAASDDAGSDGEDGDEGGSEDGEGALAAGEAAGAAGAGRAAGAEAGDGDDEVAAEVAHLRRTRVQALAFALDKAKLFLRHQVPGGLPL